MLDFDQLRVYVDALPLDDQAVFTLLAGLGTAPVIEAKDIHESLGCNRPKAKAKVERAFRRVRHAMELAPEVTDEEILEALTIGEVRQRAKGNLNGLTVHCCPICLEKGPFPAVEYALDRNFLIFSCPDCRCPVVARRDGGAKEKAQELVQSAINGDVKAAEEIVEHVESAAKEEPTQKQPSFDKLFEKGKNAEPKQVPKEKAS